MTENNKTSGYQIRGDQIKLALKDTTPYVNYAYALRRYTSVYYLCMERGFLTLGF